MVLSAWMHTGLHTFNTAPKIYLLAFTGIWIVTRFLWVIGVLYRNLKFGKNFARAGIERAGNTLKVSLSPPREWELRPGQYLKLCNPTLAWYSFSQWHPFVIAGYERIDDGTIVSLLIREKRGFTRHLGRIATTDRGLLALIDGPYGTEIPLQKYGTILLFASGIGIAGQLLYVRQVLQDYDERRTSCREMSLIWENDEETNEAALIEPEVNKIQAHAVSGPTFFFIQN